jgi:hypothetical protein
MSAPKSTSKYKPRHHRHGIEIIKRHPPTRRTRTGLLIHCAVRDCMKMWHSPDGKRKAVMLNMQLDLVIDSEIVPVSFEIVSTESAKHLTS